MSERSDASFSASPGGPPLVVDMDGTLLNTDMTWESIVQWLKVKPLQSWRLLFWWLHGRAYLKQQLGARVAVDPAKLPYHQAFLAFLRQQKQAGRRLILATASDIRMARPVADHVGLFDEVLASDGRTNLRGANKLKLLTAKFGERGFDYAGNSRVDLGVWRGAREAIVVNAGPALVRKASRCARLGAHFPPAC
jgi:phosphoserine phosphatase